MFIFGQGVVIYYMFFFNLWVKKRMGGGGGVLIMLSLREMISITFSFFSNRSLAGLEKFSDL